MAASIATVACHLCKFAAQMSGDTDEEVRDFLTRRIQAHFQEVHPAEEIKILDETNPPKG